jgi:hypothetical protein
MIVGVPIGVAVGRGWITVQAASGKSAKTQNSDPPSLAARITREVR